LPAGGAEGYRWASPFNLARCQFDESGRNLGDELVAQSWPSLVVPKRGAATLGTRFRVQFEAHVMPSTSSWFKQELAETRPQAKEALELAPILNGPLQK
jgi:hypothetical protein